MGYSGEEIFEGIFFFDGPVVDLIPNLAPFKMSNFTKTQEEYAIFSNKVKLILDRISADNAQYFNNFKNTMIYGNHIDIQDAIGIANNQVLQAIQGLEEFENAVDIMNNPEGKALVDSLGKTGMASITDYFDGNDMRDDIEARLAWFGEGRLCLGPGVVFYAVAFIAVVAIVALGIVIWREMALWEEYNVTSSSHLSGDSKYFYEQTIAQIVRLSSP